MKVVAWDTSSRVAALVALEWDSSESPSWENVRLAGELSLNADVTHSEKLLWAIHQMLESARWELADVDALGVGTGPGSFTGLRIGVTTARTLAHTLKKPIIPVSSLAALARPITEALSSFSKEPVFVVAATDACKGELFSLWGESKKVLKYVSDFKKKAGVHEEVITPDQLMTNLKSELKKSGKSARWIRIGEGSRRYLDAWKTLPLDREIKVSLSFPDLIQGRYLGKQVWEAYYLDLQVTALDVHPRYLRASDAELKLKAGLL